MSTFPKETLHGPQVKSHYQNVDHFLDIDTKAEKPMKPQRSSKIPPLTTKAAGPGAREARASCAVGGPQPSPELDLVWARIGSCFRFLRVAIEKHIEPSHLARLGLRPTLSEVAITTARRSTTLSRAAKLQKQAERMEAVGGECRDSQAEWCASKYRALEAKAEDELLEAPRVPGRLGHQEAKLVEQSLRHSPGWTERVGAQQLMLQRHDCSVSRLAARPGLLFSAEVKAPKGLQPFLAVAVLLLEIKVVCGVAVTGWMRAEKAKAGMGCFGRLSGGHGAGWQLHTSWFLLARMASALAFLLREESWLPKFLEGAAVHGSGLTMLMSVMAVKFKRRNTAQVWHECAFGSAYHAGSSCEELVMENIRQQWTPLPGESWLARPLKSLGLADVFHSEGGEGRAKRVREWPVVAAKRQRSGSWHSKPLLAPPKPDTIGRSLFAKPKSGHSKEPFRESGQQGSRPSASTRGPSAKDSDGEDSEEDSQGSEAESKASKASASKKGKDGEDAEGAIEVKDAETLWKVNIEAVYRRKNPKLLSKVPDFIAKYKANGTPLAHLYAKVCRTYELDPKVMWATRGEEDDNADEDGACFKDNAFDDDEAKEKSKHEGASSTGGIFGATGGASSGGLFAGTGLFDSAPSSSSTGTDLSGLFSAAKPASEGLLAKPAASIFDSAPSSSGSIFGGAGGSASEAALPSSGGIFMFGANAGSAASTAPATNIFGGASSSSGAASAPSAPSAPPAPSAAATSATSIFQFGAAPAADVPPASSSAGVASSGGGSIFGAEATSGNALASMSQSSASAPSSSSNIFGATPGSIGNIFGAASSGSSIFGSEPGSSSSTSGLFGATQPASSPSTGSIFGAPADTSSSNIFGAAPPSASTQPAGCQSSGSIFGALQATATPSSGSIFGSQPASSPNSGSLFGATPTPPTGSPSSGSIFGAVQAASSGGIFGAAQPATSTSSGSIFGSASGSGLGIFTAPTGSASTSPGLFGAPAASAGGIFGAPSAGANIFGQPAQPAQPAQPPQPAVSAGGLFGASAGSQGGGIFGGTTGGIFNPAQGAASSAGAGNLFGQAGGNIFGSGAGGAGAFGASGGGGGGGVFGQSSGAGGSNIFGAPAPGAASTGGMFQFGAPTPAPQSAPCGGGGSLFGQPQPQPSPGGGSAFMFGQGPAQSQGSADMFGQPAAGPNPGFGGSPFGGAPQGFPPPGAGFGQPAAGAAGAFGGFGPAPGAGGFGAAPQAAGGNLFAQPNPGGPPPGRRIVRAKRRAG
ncbi:nup98 [Symbiodinium sp. CCMP2592]|nr:nup98 [Symbiodinium sp. CCMP2592]